MSREDIQAKFRSVTAGLLSSEDQQTMIEQVGSLDRATDIRGLTAIVGRLRVAADRAASWRER
jgi:hypothetical protein